MAVTPTTVLLARTAIVPAHKDEHQQNNMGGTSDPLSAHYRLVKMGVLGANTALPVVARYYPSVVPHP
jgi:hypothetical protein